MFKVIDKTRNKIYVANENDNLKEILINNNVYIDAPCGGLGTCGKCKVEVYGKPQLSCTYSIKSDIEITHSYGDKSQKIDKKVVGTSPIDVAIDIGTTTIEMAFLSHGNLLHYQASQNKQKSYGADVISRINYEDPQKLTDVLREQLSEMIEEGLNKSNGKINQITIVANTTIIHFLVGLSPKSLAVAPFTPLITEAVKKDNVKILPSLSAFIGADITSSIAYFDLMNKKENIMLIDLGTNGEMVYSKGGKLTCASTAAGPAFEGANLSCGVGGISGGISKVSFCENEIKLNTVNNEPEIGFCGSGAMDLIACLVELEIIDETGRIVDLEELAKPISLKIYKKYIRNLNSQKVFYIHENCYLSARDIREFQLAKSAIRAGMEVLCEDSNEIDKLIITGGLGNHINIDSAFKIQMFNEQLKEKTIVVKNAALLGAIESLNPSFFEKTKEVYKFSEYLELSTSAKFTSFFVEYMNF